MAHEADTTCRPRARRSILCFATALTSLLVSTAAFACPSCPVGVTARQQVLDGNFGTNLMIALAPFLLVGFVARQAERIGRQPSTREHEEVDT